MTAIFVASFALQNDVSRVIADDGPASTSETREPTPGTPEYIERALRKKVSLSVNNLPLRDVLQDLSKQAEVTLHVETSALDAVRQNANELAVTVSLEDLPLRSMLRIILLQLELKYLYYEGVLMITTPESAEQKLTTRVYKVVDLISKDDDTPPSEYDYDSLIEAIVTTLAPHSWDDVGGPGSIKGHMGTIVVSAEPAVHELITQALSAMRKAKEIALKHPESAPLVASIPLSRTEETAEEDDAIWKALDSIVNFEFNGTAWRNVAAQISKQQKINVLLHESALDAVRLGPESPVTISLKNVTLRQALRLICLDDALTYVISDGALMITTPEYAEQDLITRMYPVLDLVDAAPDTVDFTGEATYSDFDYDSLVDLTTKTITPTMWDEVGGPASIAVMHSFGFLIISQTQEGHEKVEKLCTDLRQTAPETARITKREGNERVRLVVYVVPKPALIGGSKMTNRGKREFGAGGLMGTVSREPMSASQMLELITTLIEPGSWTTRDDVYARAVAGRIVIRHTDTVHRQIRELANRLGVLDLYSTNSWWWGKLRGGLPGFGGR